MVGYIEAKDNDESAVVDDQQDEEGEQELEGEEKLDPVSVELSTHEPNRRLRSAAKAVMLSNRLALGDNNLASDNGGNLTRVALASGSPHGVPRSMNFLKFRLI